MITEQFSAKTGCSNFSNFNIHISKREGGLRHSESVSQKKLLHSLRGKEKKKKARWSQTEVQWNLHTHTVHYISIEKHCR